jgi:hypothetical protein
MELGDKVCFDTKFPEGYCALAFRFYRVVISHYYLQVAVHSVLQEVFIIAKMVTGTRVNKPDRRVGVLGDEDLCRAQ